jgi:hypothetical protein
VGWLRQAGQLQTCGKSIRNFQHDDVDEQCEVDWPGILATGDEKSRIQFGVHADLTVT